ncbi:efflux RND transporter permease subunit [Fodinisporobacter ferrooxydans]|uniref:Efflux RND transporter permease subunit n=1 Tax=Fodinisporobacter ferrooxydans TaxID=2901836 RepID=A0ABY4CMH6_9BACL|nr:efflux RND transporter permease subunit [Alicyclobacillaceae bacterium MYW30-H2]
MKIANFSVHRPVTISMIMIALIIVGVIAIPLLPVDLYPKIDVPVAVVTTSWTGASPGEVESQVSKPIEAAMATISGVNEVDSTSSSGASLVIVHFNYGINLDQATLNMRDKLDRIRNGLPTGADAPLVLRIDPNSQPIQTLALYGNTDPVTLRNIADNTVSPALQRVNGIASVNTSGGRVRQVQVLVDPNKLTQYDVSINSIVQALGNDNNSLDAGLVQKGSQLIPLHLNGDFRSVAEIQDVQVPLKNGQTVPLGQLAKIVDTYQDVTLESRVNGQESVSLSLTKQSDSNTVTASDNVLKELPAIQKKLPQGVHLTVLNDQAKYIRDSINTVVNHTLLGGVFSILILALFLRSIRATLVIGVVIPIAVISTFSMMYFSNQSINTITLGGLALGLGSLVDFAVVVLESIFRKRQEGLMPEEAAKAGAAEVGTAVFASALAQIAVFLPIAFASGLAAEIFLPMALTVSFSHIAALFASITLVPMLAAKILTKPFTEELPEGPTKNPAIHFGRWIRALTSFYVKVLKWALGNRKKVVAATAGLLVASLAIAPLIGFELMPSSDQGVFNVNIQLAQGTDFATTNKLATRIEAEIQKIPEVDTMYSTVGSLGGGFIQHAATNTAQIGVKLKDLSQRKRSTDQVVEQVRGMVRGIPGAQITVSAQQSGMGGNGAPVQVNVMGPDLRVLEKLGTLVADQVRQVPGTRNVQNTLDKTVPEFDLTIDRTAAAHYGISVKEIQSALNTMFQGTVATHYKTGDSQIDVVVKYPEQYSQKLENLNSMVVTSASGIQIPLLEVAKIQPGYSPAQIKRQNQQRLATITAFTFNAPTGTVTQEINQRLAQIRLPEGYQISMGGQQSDMSKSFMSLGLVLLASPILVYMVMAGQFESLYGPFIIMFSLPPTIIGAFFGLLVTHRTININSITGMIMLIGIVVNNAIVLVDYTNQLRKRGYTLQEALIQAGQIRLRPILMTTATTVLAMLPLVIGFGQGAEQQAPMATVVAFGLIFSTMITLVLVPVVYTMFDNRIEKRRQKKALKKQMRMQSGGSVSM